MSDNSRKDQQSGSVDRQDILWKQMNVEVNKSSLKDSERTNLSEEEAKKRAEEAKNRSEEDAKKRAEKAKNKSEEEAKKRAEEAKNKSEEAAKKRAEEDAKKKSEEESKNLENITPQEEHINLSSEVREIKNCLVDFVEVVKSFKESFEILADDYSNVKSEVQNIKLEIKSNFEAQNRKIEVKIDDLITSNKRLSDSIENNLASSLNNTISKLEDANRRLADECNKRVKDLEKASENYVKALNQAENSSIEINRKSEEIDRLESNIHNLEDSYKKLENEYEVLDNSKKEKEKELNNNIADCVYKINELNKQLKTEQQKVQDKEKEYNDYVTTTEDERARERISQQEISNKKDEEYKTLEREKNRQKLDLENQIKDLKEQAEADKKVIEEKTKKEIEDFKIKAEREKQEFAKALKEKLEEKFEQAKREYCKKYIDFEDLHTCYNNLSDDVKIACKSYFGDGGSIESIVFKLATRDNIEYFWQYIADRIKENKLPQEEIDRLKKIFDIAFNFFTMGNNNYARLEINIGDKFDVGTMQVKPGTQQSGNVKEIFFKGYKVVSSNVIRKQSLIILE